MGELPVMAKPLKIFQASLGLNVKVDPTRITYDPENGVQDLAVAYNVDHDQTGRINRRKGFATTLRTEAIHSLWCGDGPCFFVTGTSLCRLALDLSYTVLATVTQGSTVDFEQVKDTVYWVNGYEKGQIQNGANSAWVRGEYYGPTTKRTLSDPPIGTMVTAHSGHMYIVQGDVVWYSDPYSLNAFDLSRGFLPFESEIRMFRSVTGGIFAGDEKAVYFLRGNDPKKFSLDEVLSSPVIKGTDAKIDLSKIGFQSLRQNETGIGAMWTCHSGICLGMPNGQVFNLSYKKLTKMSALSGSGLVMGDRYITLLNS
jgi:hypothetical protein